MTRVVDDPYPDTEKATVESVDWLSSEFTPVHDFGTT